MPPLVTTQGAVVATGLYFNDLAAGSPSTPPDDSPFFVCSRAFPKMMWIVEIGVVFAVGGGSGCEVVVQRTIRGFLSAYPLGTVSLTGTPQVVSYVDLTNDPVTDRRLEIEEKLTLKLNGTILGLRGLCVQALLVPFEQTGLSVPKV